MSNDVTLEELREASLDVACLRDSYTTVSLTCDPMGYECTITTDDIGCDFNNNIYYDDMFEVRDEGVMLFQLITRSDTEDQAKSSMLKRLIAIRDAIDGKTSHS